jgi:hypothetical protein
MMRQQGMIDAAFENGAEQEREKWQGVIADKDAEIARLRAALGETKQ